MHKTKLTLLIIISTLLVLGSTANAFNLIDLLNYVSNKILPTGMVTAQTGYDVCNNGIGWSEPTSAAKKCGWPRGSKGYVKDCCCCFIKVHVHDLGAVFEDRDVLIKYRPAYGSGKLVVYYSTDNSSWTQATKFYVPFTKANYNKTVHIPGKFRYIKLRFDTGRYLDWSSVKVLTGNVSRVDLYIDRFDTTVNNQYKIIYAYTRVGNKGSASTDANVILYYNGTPIHSVTARNLTSTSKYNHIFTAPCASFVKLKVCAFPTGHTDVDNSNNCMSKTVECKINETTTTTTTTIMCLSHGSSTRNISTSLQCCAGLEFKEDLWSNSTNKLYTCCYPKECSQDGECVPSGTEYSQWNVKCENGTWVNISQPTKIPPCDSYGDVDMDGYVTYNDSHLIEKYIGGLVSLTQEQLRRADVNSDGEVNVLDVQIILQYLNNFTSTFPVCEEQKNISIDQFTCTPIGSLKAQCILKFGGLDSSKVYSVYVGGNKVDEEVYAAGITVFSNSNQTTVVVVSPKEGTYQLGAWLFNESTPDITKPALAFWDNDPINIGINLR